MDQNLKGRSEWLGIALGPNIYPTIEFIVSWIRVEKEKHPEEDFTCFIPFNPYKNPVQ